MSSDSNLGLGGGATASSQIYSAPSTIPSTTTGVSGNVQIKDSTSTADQTGFSANMTLTQKGVFTNLPNSPSLPAPNDQNVDYALANPATPANLSSSGGSASAPTAATVNSDYDTAFEALVQGNPDEQSLLLAHYTSSPGTPMTALEQQAYAQVVANLNINPDDYTPTAVKSDFTEKLSNAFDDEFSSLVQNQKPPLSKANQANLKQLHYNPGSTFAGSDDSTLQSQFKSLESQATTNTAKQFGIPLNADGSPTVAMSANTNANAALQNGYYQKFVSAGISASNLSTSDQTALQAYMADPTTPVSDAVKSAAASITASATAQTIQTLNLQSVGFTPAAAGTFPTVTPMIANFIKSMNDMTTQATNLVGSMPDGAAKTNYMNILKQISNAMQDFENTIYSAQGMTSQKAQAASTAKLDMALAQIAKNGESAKNAQQQAAKMASLGVLGQIIMAIITVVMAIVAALTVIFTLGAAAPAVIAGMAALIAGIVAASAAVAETATEVGVSVGVSVAIDVAVDAAVEAAVSGAAEGATEGVTEALVNNAMEAGIQAAVNQAIEEAGGNALPQAAQEAIAQATRESISETVQSVIKQSITEALQNGLDEGSADALKESITQAVQTAIKQAAYDAIKTTAVEASSDTLTDQAAQNIVDSSKDSTTEGIKSAMKEAWNVTKSTYNSAKESQGVLGDVAQQVQNVGEAVSAGGDMVQGGMSVQQNLIAANMAINKANTDASQTLSDENIAILKKLIDQLIAMLSGQGDLIQYIGQTQSGMVKSTSQTMTQISAA